MLRQLEAGPQKGSRYWAATHWQDGGWIIHEDGFAAVLLTEADRERLARFQVILEADTVPLDPARYPWCAGEKPSVEGGDPVLVGCGTAPGNRAD